MSKLSLFACQLILATLFMKAFAQNAHPAFKQYTIEDGLSSSEVYQVKQDSKGYIWFATGNGVSRFNGYEFENFSMSNGLPDNTVFEIFEDPFERIWFVPISCKLSYYYKGEIHVFKYNDALQKLIKNPLKTSFCVTKNGTVFLGISHDGIYEISSNGIITHHFDKPGSENGLNVIQPDGVNFIYSNNSFIDLYTLKFETEKWKGMMKLPANMGAMPASGRIQLLKNKSVLLSYFDQLYIIKGLNDFSVETFPGRINCFYEDSDGDIWVGIYLGGIYHISNSDFKNKKNYLKDISVNGILQDKEGAFWFATEGNAVYYSPSKYVMTFDKFAGLSDSRANCLASDGTDMFVGLQNGCIHKISSQVNAVYNCNNEGESSNGVSALFYDDFKKQLWVSANLHPGIVANEKFSAKGIQRIFSRMLLDSEKKYWFACSNGVYKLAEDQKMLPALPNGEKINRTNAIIEFKKNFFYIGAMDGLWSYDAVNGTCNYLGSKDPLLKNRILDLALTPDSSLLIATKGAGLLIYDQVNVYQINVAKGLCGDNVYRISSQGAVMWAATNRGLNRISISTNKPLTYAVTGYTTSDGLASNEVNDVSILNGKVWVATNKGLSVFDPNHAVSREVSLPVYITNVFINDKDTALSDQYELAYDQNNIKIRFLALGYKNAGKLKYRYKMLGLDDEWKYTSSREIQFTTLPANKYSFILSVYNSSGEWSIGKIKASFLINTPFWQKWWFYIISLLLLSYLALQIFKYRIRKAHREDEKNLALYKMLMNLKLKALRAQMNPHFTFNVMNSIQHFIINKDEESANRYLSKFSKLIRSILNNSENNTVPIAEEIKVLKLYLDLESMRFEQRFEYEIDVDPSIDTAAVEIPSMLIQPYIENAVKHGVLPSGKPGEIKVKIEKQGALLKCTVKDNGIGRVMASQKKANDAHKSFGTAITQERLAVINELYNSSLSEKIIDLYDEHGNATGTLVEIYIPLIKI
ncbi:MAG TPA: two-component regulator propeller domain-containing protein [Bacteroidia bacterium]